MKLTKEYILKRVNRLLITFRVTWEELVDELDMAIEEINTYLSTKYPPVSIVLDDFAAPDKTYSYRAGGEDHEYFPLKYFNNIVIPFAAMQLLTIEEEFSELFNKYANQTQENLFFMARDEITNIPSHLISAPQGVYFANPNPEFKYNPEEHFNREIFVEDPKVKVFYSWGDIQKGLVNGVKVFVDKPLPVDNNSYLPGTTILPIVMMRTTEEDKKISSFFTHLVDHEGNVLGRFEGWSLTPEGEIINGTIKLGHEDITLYARFDKDVVPIKYNGNGGTVQNWEPAYTFTGSDPIYPSGGTVERLGFTFLGFNPPQIMPPIDKGPEDIWPEPLIELKALWTLTKYNITYMNVGEDFKGTESYYFGSYFELPVLSFLNSTFVGWFDNPQFIGDPVTHINENDYGDKVFYAQIIQEHITIKFEDFNGVSLDEEIILKGSSLPYITRKGDNNLEYKGLYYEYLFDGWVEKNVEDRVFRTGDILRKDYVFVPSRSQMSVKEITMSVTNGTFNEEILFKNGVYISYQEIYDIAMDSLRKNSNYNSITGLEFDGAEVIYMILGGAGNEKIRLVKNVNLLITTETPDIVFEVEIPNEGMMPVQFKTLQDGDNYYITQSQIASEILKIADVDFLIKEPEEGTGNPKTYLFQFNTSSGTNTGDRLYLGTSISTPPIIQGELIPEYEIVMNDLYFKDITLIGFPNLENPGRHEKNIRVPKIGLTNLENLFPEYFIDVNGMSTQQQIYDFVYNPIKYRVITGVHIFDNQYTSMYLITSKRKIELNFVYKDSSGNILEEYQEFLNIDYFRTPGLKNKIYIKSLFVSGKQTTINDISVLYVSPEDIEKYQTGFLANISMYDIVSNLFTINVTIDIQSIHYSISSSIQFNRKSVSYPLPSDKLNSIRTNVLNYFNSNFKNVLTDGNPKSVLTFTNEEHFMNVSGVETDGTFVYDGKTYQIKITKIQFVSYEKDNFAITIPKQIEDKTVTMFFEIDLFVLTPSGDGGFIIEY